MFPKIISDFFSSENGSPKKPHLELLDYQEALLKLKNILCLVSGLSELKDPQILRENYGPFASFCLALWAHTKVLRHLNDAHLHSPVPWNMETDFPSHPSIAADISKYSQCFQANQTLTAVLNSFSGWTLFSKEKTECGCGMTEAKEINLEIVLNHVISIDHEHGLCIKEFIGVRSDNPKFLKKHYKPISESRIDQNLYIISLSGIYISLQDLVNFCEKKESFQLKTTESVKMKEFNDREFRKRLFDLTKEIVI